MGFFSNWFGSPKEEKAFFSFINAKARELHIKEHMIEHAIDLIAKTVAKSEIQVFKNVRNSIKVDVDDIYYKLNIRPNPNDDGTKFLYNIVSTLLKENRALIVKLKNDDLYLADRWEETKDILKGKTYSKVIVLDDNLAKQTLTNTFHADDVIYLSLGQSKIKNTLDNFYEEYAGMLRAASDGYQQSKIKKYRLTPSTPNISLTNPENGEKVSMKEYKEALQDGLLSNESSVSMIGSSFDLELLDSKGNITDSKDFQGLIKHFGDSVAMAFNIPLDVFYGTQTDKSNSANDFITFAVSPIIETIEDSFNAKLITKESYLKGERIKFNTFTMKHFDIMDVATSLDKLFAIGWSHNELKSILGLPVVKEEWANKHHVTKNYMGVEEASEGGG